PEPIRRHVLLERKGLVGLAGSAGGLPSRADRVWLAQTRAIPGVNCPEGVPASAGQASLPRPPPSALRGVFRDDAAPQVEDHAPDHDEWLDRRAVHYLRRPLPARDAICDDASRAGVDRLALRRSAGAALAPDARHEQVAGDP